jgi:hypothetical protein
VERWCKDGGELPRRGAVAQLVRGWRLPCLTREQPRLDEVERTMPWIGTAGRWTQRAGPAPPLSLSPAPPLHHRASSSSGGRGVAASSRLAELHPLANDQMG